MSSIKIYKQLKGKQYTYTNKQSISATNSNKGLAAIPTTNHTLPINPT